MTSVSAISFETLEATSAKDSVGFSLSLIRGVLTKVMPVQVSTWSKGRIQIKTYKDFSRICPHSVFRMEHQFSFSKSQALTKGFVTP
jgi:hypothetical protein